MMEQKRQYHDYPFADVTAKAREKVLEGHTVYQKFTCAGCGARLTIDQPNLFFETGTCDRCSTITNIRARGCNYMLVTGRTMVTT